MSPGQTDPIQCHNMGPNGHGITLHGVIMVLMGNVHAGGGGGVLTGGLSVLLHRNALNTT